MVLISRATKQDDLESVYQFRYKVYVEEMNRRQKYADHKNRVIIDPLDTPEAIILAAWENDQVVGTARTNFMRMCNIGEYQNYYNLVDLPAPLRFQTSVTTRLMIDSRKRGSTLGARLSCKLYQIALEGGIKKDYIDCNDHLVPYFTEMGYCHQHDLSHPEYDDVKVMCLDLTDQAHLDSVRSPFRKILRNYRVLAIT